MNDKQAAAVQSLYCPECERLSRELAAVKGQAAQPLTPAFYDEPADLSSPESQPVMPEPVAFEDWWQRKGEFLRAGGGQYEKTFAYHAWEQATTLADARCARMREALETAVLAMRAPLDGWKGEVERRALDAARAALEQQP